MKFIIGIFAIIGALVVLIVFGGIALVSYGISSLPEKPEYANRDKIEKKYSQDLTIINNEIKSETLDFNNKLSSDILAIYYENIEILKKHKYTGKSYYLSGDSGVGTLTENDFTFDCVVYAIKTKGKTYYIYFLDRNKSAPQQSTSNPSLPPK